MQLQNLPRGAKRFEDVDVGVLAEQVLAGRACDADEVALLVRATLTARAGDTLVACDYSSIEARATAWAAGDEAALDVFRAQRDPYKVAASAIYSCAYDGVTKAQRQTGKLAELACGYGGGTGALERIARAQRVDVSGLGRDDIVAGWRRLHAPIVRLWYACERAFTAAANGRATYVGPWRFLPGADVDAGAIACMLPSRRLIVYADVHVDGDGCASYLGTRGRQSIYGGKLVENAVQATCRDLMADALVRAERAGLRPVLTVHDEIVCEVPACAGEEALAFLRAIMVDAPGWSAGLPIEAEGWIGKRYRK
jgi:DNA polymerase